MEGTSKDLKHLELSEQYYKGRKQLMLYSGLFFIYEFIGVEIPFKPFNYSELEIKTPEAVPIVLLILVIYFMYRTIIGWFLSDPMIRDEIVSGFDLYPTVSIAIFSILLFVYQTISQVQVAEGLISGKSDVYAILLSVLLFYLQMSLAIAITSVYIKTNKVLTSFKTVIVKRKKYFIVLIVLYLLASLVVAFDFFPLTFIYYPSMVAITLWLTLLISLFALKIMRIKISYKLESKK